jgi:AraC-like DNA-binding protein
MSWAGKHILPATLRSLFRQKEQAPSSPVRTLAPEAAARTGKRLQAWVYGKGYRLPDRTPHESAERMGVDFKTLHQYCLMHLGVDFRSLRTRLRIRDAQEQMKEEPLTPTSVIARRVGYQDRSNFSRHFKEITGLTPDAWRKRSL